MPRVSMGNRGWLRIFIYSGGAGMIGKICQFVALTTLALVLVPSDYGRFAVAQIVATGVVSIVSSSFAISATREAARIANVNVTPREVIQRALGTRRRSLGLVVGAMLVAVPVLYALLSGEGFGAWTIPWSLLTAAIIVCDIVVGAFAGSGRLRTSGLLDAGRMVTAGILALALGYSLGFIGAAYGLVLGDVILSVYALVHLRGHHPPKAEEHDLFGDATVRAGLVSNGVTQLSMWALTGAIQMTAGLTGVGTFSVANRFATLILVAPGLISKNSLGLLARESAVSQKTRWRSALSYLTICMVLVLGSVVVVLLTVTYGIPTLGLAYPGLHTVVLVLTVGTAIRAMATAMGVVCVAWGRLGTWQLSDVLAAVTVVAWILFSIVTDESIDFMVIAMALGGLVALVTRGVSLFSRRRSLA